ncbi:hypothetical protein ACFSX9_03780 [Flavobacterium ardleyense]|uniref:DUF3808 domain-containing protein n=1 Tax=Flavobacterium ardleyense TaxID=2038737 RepID=A0ABW5Z4T3_9FLAO
MKKLILSAALLLSVATFAQKEELKTLKKIYSKKAISEKDLAMYKDASDALQSKATEESDKVYAELYKTMYPTVVLASKGDKASPQDLMKLYTPEFVKEYGAVIDETIEFEKKSGKKIHTDELIAEKIEFKSNLSALAMSLNGAAKFKEGSDVFYNLYIFDPKQEGKSLHNAALLAIQSKDYKLSEKRYEELYKSDYLNNSVHYYAVNKATGKEEDLLTKENRTKFIGLGVYEKPRDEKVSKMKPEVLKMLAILYDQNGELAKAKEAYAGARLLLPNDNELKTGEFSIYYNEGFAGLADESKLVDEMNAISANDKKMPELVAKRKEMFSKVIPLFEKAYSIKPDDANTRSVLKLGYEVTGQTEKVKSLK